MGSQVLTGFGGRAGCRPRGRLNVYMGDQNVLRAIISPARIAQH